MSQQELPSSAGIYARVFALVLIMLVAAGMGLWLGNLSGRRFEKLPNKDLLQASENGPMAGPVQSSTVQPPLYFFANTRMGADLEVVKKELQMAAHAGVHRVCITVPVAWPGELPDEAAMNQRLKMVLETDPTAEVLLYVVLDPPAAWLDAHPADRMRLGDAPQPFAAPASAAWLRDAQTALDGVMQWVQTSAGGDRVIGYVIAALETGQWSLSDGYDASEANANGFRSWLSRRYTTDALLQKHWGTADATLATAVIPLKPDTADPLAVFFATPQEQQRVDYLHFVSDTVADAIAALVAHIKHESGFTTVVLAAYGHAFELLKNDAGHFALMDIIDSDIDGFTSPVSLSDRGLGGTGGFMGPVDSATYHEKQWYIVDDMRTGIARNPETNAIERMKGLRAEDVYAMQTRNYAQALCHHLGLMWADTDSDGRFHDEEMWRRFGLMRDAYFSTYAPPSGSQEGVPVDLPPYGIAPAEQATLCVVVDEASRFYQRCDELLNKRLLREARDSALRCGVPTRFCLVQDLLEERAAHADVYLFCNLFSLSTEERQRLHAILARKKAAAIWLYAPGYIDGTAAVDNIGLTTRMTVKAFDGPGESGSKYLLTGRWLDKDEEFGVTAKWAPLFYVDDSTANQIAQYRQSNQVSIAAKFLEEGWASIFIAEPTLTPALLREILMVLEKHVYFRRTAGKQFDAADFGPNILAIHAGEAGERLVDLQDNYNVQDLLNPEAGWPSKQVFNLMLEAGETRILRLTPEPLDETAPPAPQ